MLTINASSAVPRPPDRRCSTLPRSSDAPSGRRSDPLPRQLTSLQDRAKTPLLNLGLVQKLLSFRGFAIVGVRELDVVSVTRLYQTMLTRLPERCLIQTNHRRETQETPRGRSRLVSGTSPCHSSWPAVMIVLRVRAFLSRCDRVDDHEPRGCARPRRVPQSPDSNASLPPSSGSRALCRVLHRADATGRPGPKADRSSFFGRPGEKRSFKALPAPPSPLPLYLDNLREPTAFLSSLREGPITLRFTCSRLTSTATDAEMKLTETMR